MVKKWHKPNCILTRTCIYSYSLLISRNRTRLLRPWAHLHLSQQYLGDTVLLLLTIEEFDSQKLKGEWPLGTSPKQSSPHKTKQGDLNREFSDFIRNKQAASHILLEWCRRGSVERFCCWIINVIKCHRYHFTHFALHSASWE